MCNNLNPQAVIFSLFLHVALVVAASLLFMQQDRQQAASGEVVVVMLGEGSKGKAAKPQLATPAKPQVRSQLKSSAQVSPKIEEGHLYSGASDLGGNSGNSDILAQIRKKIERAKIYPAKALAEGLSGVVRLSFSLDDRGLPINVSIIKSSGYTVLDREAQQAVHRAAPYPRYAAPIAFNMQFVLENP